MSVEFIDRGIMDNRTQSYTMNPDKRIGLSNAVKNGQTRLALEYAEQLIGELMTRIIKLELEVSNASTKDAAVEELAKSTTKNTRAKKTTVDQEES